MRKDEEFISFAEGCTVRLRQIAFLMCRDWHLAQDLTQTTLTKVYIAWPRLTRRDTDPFFYARKVLLNTLLDHKRRPSTSELATDQLPEHPDSPDLTAARLTLLGALALLSPRDRAIVLLRHWEDHSVETTAEIVGVSTSVVKTQTARGLAILRAHLGEERMALFS
ncbi:MULTISPECIES: sigma-70 family RNA polymerase sigma factor [Kitasatospora]|uniref:RNA polymerase sigma-70 factor (Sigma-E family) n=2 Tax=Kitasatospora TaxID=2063 RepID=A0ABT1J7H0_9ACTN|nr:sigma-70 family RNA polymerase sigma factor [Kitasatospora paracochleata]MCP2313389.1 RNA polymerase sigma-70 factor (sigma-E family) [Kitasatospora paracochleata]